MFLADTKLRSPCFSNPRSYKSVLNIKTPSPGLKDPSQLFPAVLPIITAIKPSQSSSKSSAPSFDMASILESVKIYSARLDKELAKQPMLVKLENQTGVPKVQLVLGVLVFGIIFMQFNSFALFLTNVVGLAGPSFVAVKMLGAGAAGGESAIVNCMFYFMIFAALMLLEYTLPSLTTIIPLYPFAKIALLGWLFSPKYCGASLLANRLVKNASISVPSGAAVKKTSPLSERLSTSMKSAMSTPLNDE